MPRCRMNTGIAMTTRTRKLTGTVLILLSIVAWSILASWIYMSLLVEAPWWLTIGFFALAGTSWFVPAAVIIRWMVKPD